MPIEIGHAEAIFRYPVKSMGGERLEAVQLGWHGLEGDRRLAFRRRGDCSGFPWLSASQLPDLLLFAPHRPEDGAQGGVPTHVRTPDGEVLPVFGEELATEVGRRLGAPVKVTGHISTIDIRFTLSRSFLSFPHRRAAMQAWGSTAKKRSRGEAE